MLQVSYYNKLQKTTCLSVNSDNILNILEFQ